jgi:hypothetical protein
VEFALGRRGSLPLLATQVSARKKNLPASPLLGVSKLEADREPQDGQIEGGKSDSSDPFSPEDISALAQMAAALASVATQFKAQKAAPAASVAPLTAHEADLIVDAIFRRTFRRIPAPQEECPFTGLNRGQFYELFKLRAEGKPVIRTASPLREKDQKHGARHYNLGDAMRYMKQLAEQQDRETSKT